MNFDILVDDMKEEIINTTCKLVRIKSVKSSKSEGKPFGEGVNNCLEYALQISENIGFRVKNIDGYVGYAEFGEGNEFIGILVHLDVVPEGDGWSVNPFDGVIKDNKIYGRGTMDDKGPAASVLYAMKAIRDSGVPLSKRIRIIFGLDEENGSECIKHYIEKKEELPHSGFTPDAGFPAIYGEKGILQIRLFKKFCIDFKNYKGEILKIEGGSAPNIVPDSCIAVVYKNSSLVDYVYKYCENKQDFIVKEEEDKIYVEVKGIASHASAPQKGDNAISKLLKLLKDIPYKSGEIKNIIETLFNNLGNDCYGQYLGCAFEDKEWGKLTVNLGKIHMDEEGLEAFIDIRYPNGINKEIIIKTIENKLDGISIEVVEDAEPLYISKEEEIVRKLVNVYKEYTRDDSEPMIIGGGTYARSMPNLIAYGPVFPGEKSGIHQKDEFIDINHLMKISKIYAQAIYELAK